MQFRNLIFVALMSWGASAAVGQPLQLIHVADISTVSYLGVGVQNVSAEMAKSLKLPEASGVAVTKLDPISPAAAAGMKVGDVVMQYNGLRVEGQDQFKRMVRETQAGKEVRLQIYRDGAPQIVGAKIVLRPATMNNEGELVPIQPRTQQFQGFSPDVQLNRMSWGVGILGAELESLEGQLTDYFGVKDGVLVRSVMRGSAADKAGLKAGDVITRVGDAKVTTPTDVSGRIRAGRGQSATLTVQRDRKEMSLTIALDGARPGEQ